MNPEPQLPQENPETPATNPPVEVPVAAPVAVPEQPVAPVQPAVAPQPPVAPQKKGLSKGALIAIIIGSIVGFLLLGVLALAVLFTVVGKMSADTVNKASGGTNETSAEYDSLTTYKSDDFSFAYPSDWQQKDTSNQTTIVGGVEPDAYVVILSGSGDSDVIINYTYNKGSAAVVERAKARAAMETAVKTQANSTSSQLVAMRESTGHGCAANAEYTREPELIEKGDLIGYSYGYTCDSFYGPVQGEYGVWYDEYGAQHRLLVSSLQEYWDENQAGLEEILESATAL